MQLYNRSFLITGGGSGLGAACARMFVAAGAQVVVVDLNRTSAETLVAELGAAAQFVEADVMDEVAIRNALAAAKARAQLAGVVCCAGIAAAARIAGRDGPHDFALFERVIRVNLLGTFNVLRLAADAMTRNEPGVDGERGVVICTASVAA